MPDLKNNYVIAGLVVAAAVIGVGIYIYVTKYRSKNTFKANENDERKNTKPVAPVQADAPTFVFFYATWCPHCEHMMGDWEETQKSLLGKVNVKAIESANPEMANHKIPGFPTLRMFPRGLSAPNEYIDYKGPRKAQDMIKFVMEGPEQPQ